MGNEKKLESCIKSLEDEQEKTHRFFKYTLNGNNKYFHFCWSSPCRYAIYSKTEVSDARREMERKFDILSNQALIKPKLEIFYNGQPISGNTETIEEYSSLTISLDKIFIKKGSSWKRVGKICIFISPGVYTSEFLSEDIVRLLGHKPASV